MFIPINAKADIVGSKKGKLTPAQNAQLNAWCLANKTGILDCLDRCVATETSYNATNNTATIVFKKGYIVICGRLIECEANTEVQITTPVSGNTNGKIILRYNLANVQEDEFVVTTKSGALVQEDLNENPITGVYELELYSYVATPTLVTLTRNASYVPDIGGKLSQFEASLTDDGKPLGGYDTSKGTIEERLTRLGFKEGSVSLSVGNATTNKVTRQGNYCILSLIAEVSGVNLGTTNLLLGKVSNEFIPKEKIICFAKYEGIYTTSQLYGYTTITIETSGNVFLTETRHGTQAGFINSISMLNIGYEAPPIQ